MKISAIVALAIVGSIAAFAGPQTKAGMKKMTCPVCHMGLTAKQDKMHPVAMRLKKGGPVMYCCKPCKMPASMVVKKTTTIKKGGVTKTKIGN